MEVSLDLVDRQVPLFERVDQADVHSLGSFEQLRLKGDVDGEPGHAPVVPQRVYIVVTVEVSRAHHIVILDPNYN